MLERRKNGDHRKKEGNAAVVSVQGRIDAITAGEFEIACGFDDGGGLQVEVSDQGIPFNSLSRENPDLQAGIAERNRA